MTQDTAKDVRPTISSIGIANLRAGTKVDLQLFPRLDFHASEGGLDTGAERLDEPVDEVLSKVVFLKR